MCVFSECDSAAFEAAAASAAEAEEVWLVCLSR